MSIKVQIPTPMREQAGGKAEVEVAGATVGLALADLIRQHPGLAAKLYDNGKLRPYVNVFVNDEDIRYLDDMDTAVTDGGIVALIPGRRRGLTMADAAKPPPELPEGTAVFPEIPAELGVHPLLLAALHAYVFLEGSDTTVLNPAVAEEAMDYLVMYLQRLTGPDLRRVREDMATLVGFAKSEQWPKQQVTFLHDFLRTNGIGQA